MDKPVYFYVRNNDGHPLGVVALAKAADVVLASASWCSRKDRWDRRVGVDKALGRMLGNDVTEARDSLPATLDQYFGRHCSTTHAEDIDWPRACGAYRSLYARLTK